MTRPSWKTGVPQTTALPYVRAFRHGDNPYVESVWSIRGRTLDSAGAALPACTVRLFLTGTQEIQQTAVSDTNGAYAFNVTPNVLYYVVAYKAGAPDVAGTTVNTLTGI